MTWLFTLMIALTMIVTTLGCGGKMPPTRYYQLAAAPDQPARPGDLTLVLEQLETELAYDDERIVYRTTPYRFDYYHYHRWSSAPGAMVTNFIEQALEGSGMFRAVVRELVPDAHAVLGGRVIAIEEVDVGKKRWAGRIALELTLREPRGGTQVWTEQFVESEPLQVQSPEGLARALSKAMQRIMTRAAPTISRLTVAAAQRRDSQQSAVRPIATPSHLDSGPGQGEH